MQDDARVEELAALGECIGEKVVGGEELVRGGGVD